MTKSIGIKGKGEYKNKAEVKSKEFRNLMNENLGEETRAEEIRLIMGKTEINVKVFRKL